MYKFIFLVIVLFCNDVMGERSESLNIKIVDPAVPSPSSFIVEGKKLREDNLSIGNFSPEFSVEDLKLSEGRLFELRKDPLQAYLIYCRLMKEGLIKEAFEHFFLLDDAEADPEAVKFLRTPDTMKRISELWKTCHSVTPLFLIYRRPNTVDLVGRMVGTGAGRGYINPDAIRMKKDGEIWKQLPISVSETNPATSDLYKILKALGGKNIELTIEEGSR